MQRQVVVEVVALVKPQQNLQALVVIEGGLIAKVVHVDVAGPTVGAEKFLLYSRILRDFVLVEVELLAPTVHAHIGLCPICPCMFVKFIQHNFSFTYTLKSSESRR